MTEHAIRSKSGRSLEELSLEALRRGELTAEDLLISAGTLRHQAQAAEAAGYRQLGENLRRGAELTGLSDRQVLEMYNALRPGRAGYEELAELARHLEEDLGMPLTAALVRDAAAAYRERGILKAQ